VSTRWSASLTDNSAMPTVEVMLASPELTGLRRVGGHDRALVRQVQLAERLADLEQAAEGSLVVLSRAASVEAAGYRLDVALRQAGVHGVAAVVVLASDSWHPPATATDIAERVGLALLAGPYDADLARLLQVLGRVLTGGAEDALGRIDLALRTVAVARDEHAAMAAATAALGAKVEMRDPAAGELSAPVVVGGSVEGQLVAPTVDGYAGTVSRVVLELTAETIARRREAAHRADELPLRSRQELLSELLIASTPHTEELLDQARTLGLPIDGWHVAVRIELESGNGIDGGEIRRFELLEAASRLALQTALQTGSTWFLARIGQAILLLRTYSHDPGPDAGRAAAKAATRALKRVSDRFPDLRFGCGVGAAHEGVLGLRASAEEAHAALARARVAGRRGEVATFDAVGVQRMLIEWYASDTARRSVREQLSPLDRLGPKRAETALLTLKTYLDEQGSIVRTAQALHLHRNAVGYRLRRIVDLLGVDLDDPDQRLALELACRARLLGD
jgi:sugar diacid utilization regulator